jgi:hypothetical protein
MTLSRKSSESIDLWGWKFEKCADCGSPARVRCDGVWLCGKHVRESKEYVYRQ